MSRTSGRLVTGRGVGWHCSSLGKESLSEGGDCEGGWDDGAAGEAVKCLRNRMRSKQGLTEMRRI